MTTGTSEPVGAGAPVRLRPTAPPVYRGSSKVAQARARGWGFDDVIDAAFFAFAAGAALWLAWLVIGAGWHPTPWALLAGIAFWGLLAYLAIPRVHQVLTWLYVPDYFIGRTRTPDGLLGDPVNLALLGDEEDLHEAMRSAGWVRADPITPYSSWRIVVDSLLRRSYPCAPVSTLQLFGRPQDVAYQKEVEGNPSQRHHVRLWHTPANWVLPGGRAVDWLAAATYDRAVGLSTLTLQVTHKIDADIDVERDYVVDDIRWASPAATLQIWPDFFTAYHDKNGGGDQVITDGDLYVLNLHGVVPDSRHSVELARARAADERASRRRPGQLVIALGLIALLCAARIGSAIDSAALSTTMDFLRSSGVADARTVAYAAVGTISVILTLIVLALGWAAWNGHPRSRIALLIVLALSVSIDMSQVAALGVRHATAWILITSALAVLALLALTARPVHRWERARKAERRAARPERVQRH
ncbi:Uncharacterised protein [Actinomyces denticolens]|uniref:LssY C-terminal domain-containing protein n=1 Tax=Actinomyces TaxID=1654 RepID=UPI0009825ACC|nr:Uncharacterised protein [Actinomyces denticolens]